MKKSRSNKMPKEMMFPSIGSKKEAMDVMKMAGKNNKKADRKRRKKVRAMC